jgi:undecaprenyl diphosphate synthase
MPRWQPRRRSPMPTHVACVMDGNGRWALRRNMRRIEGHAAGERAFLETVQCAVELKISWLTLFAFSTENWNRSVDELDAIMQHNLSLLDKHGDSLNRQGVRVRFLGYDDIRIPVALTDKMQYVQKSTADNSGITLTIAFNYGGRREIVEMVKTHIRSGASFRALKDDTLSRLTQFPDMPDVDLLIRTAGEQRLSNFMLLRAAYAELIFLDVPWPDFRSNDFHAAVLEYGRRDRRFGRR